MPEPRDAGAARDDRRRRLATLGLFVVGVVGIGAALLRLARHQEPPAAQVRLTAGPEGTTRALVAHALAAEVRARGTECTVVAEPDTRSEVESVQSGAVEFALVSAVHRAEHRDPRVRIVTPLHLEVLHLLVRPELAGRVSDGLRGLRGEDVDLGPSGSAAADLAADVLDFAEIQPRSDAHPDGYVERHLGIDELEAMLDRGDRAALPPAIFHLATLPSIVAERLVREAGYTVVPLPFAEAFRLESVLDADAPGRPGGAHRDRRVVTEVTIPPFVYETNPAVPAAPLPTLGARLLLLARDSVSDATIERVLDATFETRFAHLVQPVLDPGLLATIPRHELHRGTLAYLDRREPAITGEAVDELSNTLSVVGALVGGGAFLFQGWRQRQRARRERLLARYLRRVADVERQIVEIELGSSLDLDTLIAVQRELLELKSEVLDGFTSGDFGDPAQLAALLEPINAARDHVGDLLLHVREQLEEKAQREGRAPGAVWEEAATDADGEGTR